MTKEQLRAELFRIKYEIRDALIEEFENGREATDLYQTILGIWNDMNRKDYK